MQILSAQICLGLILVVSIVKADLDEAKMSVAKMSVAKMSVDMQKDLEKLRSGQA
jgi:hypothetical protein